MAERQQLSGGGRPFDPATLRHERIATQCVCCGSEDLAATPAILMPFVAHRVFGWTPVTIDASWGLRTVPQGHAMAICKTLSCRDCGHLFCDIRFSDAELGALYGGYREAEYIRLRDHYEPGYAARNEALHVPIPYQHEIEGFLDPHLKGPLTVLDWGGDTGINTPYKSRAERIDVYDISDKALEPGIGRVTLEEATARAYRLVVCSMVLEHVSYPSDVLLAIRGAMDAESVLYVEVPLEDVVREGAPTFNTPKRHWHEHINFYTRESMSRLLENCGYRLIDLRVFPVSLLSGDLHILQIACRLAPEA